MYRGPGVIGRIGSNQNKAPSLGSLSSTARSPWVGMLQQDFVLRLRSAHPPGRTLLQHRVQSLHLSAVVQTGAQGSFYLLPLPKRFTGYQQRPRKWTAPSPEGSSKGSSRTAAVAEERGASTPLPADTVFDHHALTPLPPLSWPRAPRRAGLRPSAYVWSYSDDFETRF